MRWYGDAYLRRYLTYHLRQNRAHQYIPHIKTFDCIWLINVSSHKNHKKYFANHLIISLFRCELQMEASKHTTQIQSSALKMIACAFTITITTITTIITG
jgi:hypothetical protein